MPNTREQEAILGADENLVVVGRPGSGKTTVALWKALQRISQGNLADYQSVLFLSFSNAAVERIAEASKIELPRHLRSGLKIATYHSFCREVLSAHVTLVGLRPPFQILMPRDVRIVRNELQAEADRKLKHLEHDESRVHFDRFAPLTVQLLRMYPALRAAYSRSFPLILVDEYQDTDDDQAALVQLLGESSQVICLGDPEQRIYDFGGRAVRADRLDSLRTAHGFRLVDLGNNNHRNAGNGIREYARSILEGRPIATPSVTVFRPPPNDVALVDRITRAVTMLRAKAHQDGWGGGGPSICVMLPSNKLVQMVSRTLKALPEDDRRRFWHDIVMDRDGLSLSWDIVLGLLEEASDGSEQGAIVAVLTGLARYYKFQGKRNDLTKAAQLEAWRDALISGRTSNSPLVASLRSGIARENTWTRRPDTDIQSATSILAQVTGGTYLNPVLELLDLRGPGSEPRLLATLGTNLLASGTYAGSAELGRQCLTTESILENGGRRGRLCLMTLHRCKGGEYDAVVLAEASYPGGRFTNSDGATGPAMDYPKSRTLLNVAITRARRAVAIVTPVHDPSPLLEPRQN